MFFDKITDAKFYAKSQSMDTRRLHKAVKCNQWRFDRVTGEYNLFPCYTVILA